MISQPRIAVLGLSQPYVFMCLAYWLLVVVVLGFEPYLQFKLRFKPSVNLYLRTSSKTKDRYLGLLQSLLSSNSSHIIRLPRGLVSVYYYKESQVLSRVMLLDYLFRLLYADYHWDCSFPLSWTLHKVLTLILVPLHRDLLPPCTIRSAPSIPSLCTVISWSLYDTICYKYDCPW